MKTIDSLSFVKALVAASANSAVSGWDQQGNLIFRDGATDTQKAAAQAVLDAHDAGKAAQRNAIDAQLAALDAQSTMTPRGARELVLLLNQLITQIRAGQVPPDISNVYAVKQALAIEPQAIALRAQRGAV